MAQLSSKMAIRLGGLRLHEIALIFCEEAMQEFGRLRATSSAGTQAMLVGIVAKYFSCFGENKGAFSLAPDRVFKGRQDAKDCFLYWKALRDKNLIHTESPLTFMQTGAVLGATNELQDIISLQHTPALDMDEQHCQLLYELIAHTLGFVKGEIATLLPNLFSEVNRMSSEERAALPGIVYTVPGAAEAFKTR